MMSPDMIAGIQKLRPALPAKDFARSREFYSTLGFEERMIAPNLSEMSLGTHSFLLQDFYVADYANNFVMHAMATNLDAWWAYIESLQLASRFDVRAPIAPRLESWGLRVCYVFDPSGVLWQIAARP